ncbi:BrnT family toxin [Rhizorhabdus wittichii]|uniref:BrnT family toxin n=1 Tax=Rhizorhabdus wittichii TaxID=160791 RepID=A0A975D325_9SPHN|nr:BrnT family toxin [Rhizorhabdus wittichii]QTH22022.1 BrnT family toxin [Rhizorhabdus wittichii]
MDITFDPAKREITLRERGLDFADAAEVFAGQTFRFEDDRADYGEVRMIAVGTLRGRMVVVVYTDRPTGRHIISMRKANDREQARYKEQLG